MTVNFSIHTQIECYGGGLFIIKAILQDSDTLFEAMGSNGNPAKAEDLAIKRVKKLWRKGVNS